MCRELHQLPVPGGMMAQDSLFVAGLNMVIEAQDTKDRLDRLQQERQRQAQMPPG